MPGTASRASLFPTQIEKAGLIWEENRGFFLLGEIHTAFLPESCVSLV